MLLFTLPSLRRNNSKSRRNAKSISSNRVFSDLNSDRRDSRERCLDAEPYLPSVSSRSMVCFRYSPTEQFNRLLFCSKRFSKVTGISIISKRWIFFCVLFYFGCYLKLNIVPVGAVVCYLLCFCVPMFKRNGNPIRLPFCVCPERIKGTMERWNFYK